jgi:hypothetical protein
VFGGSAVGYQRTSDNNRSSSTDESVGYCDSSAMPTFGNAGCK